MDPFLACSLRAPRPSEGTTRTLQNGGDFWAAERGTNTNLSSVAVASVVPSLLSAFWTSEKLVRGLTFVRHEDALSAVL